MDWPFSVALMNFIWKKINFFLKPFRFALLKCVLVLRGDEKSVTQSSARKEVALCHFLLNEERNAAKAADYFYVGNEYCCFHTGLYNRRYKAIYGFQGRGAAYHHGEPSQRSETKETCLQQQVCFIQHCLLSEVRRNLPQDCMEQPGKILHRLVMLYPRGAWTEGV